ncbi:GTPase [Candidatus Shikimatogenerans bostrichidophilus]|uniref:GTPase n=1 Tax=Candidatus Shikimatogenerans bostrichidophilus TaxID=2943807 RepID=UPI0029676019
MLFNNLIDNINVICISGNGGNGKVHFTYKNKKIGKPDGGNGGNGGNIIFISDKNIFTLFNIKKIYKAYNGENGKNNCKTGKNGKNCIIKIPIGTKLIYIDKNKIKKINFNKNNIRKIILLGGNGGKGNYFYKKSNDQKTKKYTNGKKGINKNIKLILNIKVDIGIVGFPNTGKSTILSLLTNNKPNIDNYNFTTITPNLGIYNNYKKYNIIIMDLPAIIEKSYKGKGIGNKYLRHIKNYKLLLLVINYISIKDFIYQLITLKKELYKSNVKINKKKTIIILSKSDKLNKKLINIVSNFLKKNKYYYCFFSKKKKKLYLNLIKKINYFFKFK